VGFLARDVRVGTISVQEEQTGMKVYEGYLVFLG
jgi:hypothetical protein